LIIHVNEELEHVLGFQRK
jgi:PAS domain S-box-containing protein